MQEALSALDPGVDLIAPIGGDIPHVEARLNSMESSRVSAIACRYFIISGELWLVLAVHANASLTT